MKDLNSILREQLQDPQLAREYHRIAPFYRLAEQLIQLRKHRGLTQQELAQKAETTQAVVSRLENVSVRASLESVVKLANALDAVVELKLVPIEELQNDFEEITSDQDCVDEDSGVETHPGIVFFGASKKVSCQNVTWFQPDLASIGSRPQEKAHRQKQLEMA